MTKEDVTVSKHLQTIAGILDEHLRSVAGKKMGFALLVFSLDEPESQANYVSNCGREDMKQAMVDLLELWDQGMPDIPAHEKQ